MSKGDAVGNHFIQRFPGDKVFLFGGEGDRETKTCLHTSCGFRAYGNIRGKFAGLIHCNLSFNTFLNFCPIYMHLSLVCFGRYCDTNHMSAGRCLRVLLGDSGLLIQSSGTSSSKCPKGNVLVRTIKINK